MDLFYKPPLERPDECHALEENYMNCLFQKALRDRVSTNRCVMDSILWFHLECPKAVSQFDDPMAFKRKVRDFLAEARTAMENVVSMSDDQQRVHDEYNFAPYPEDIKEHKELRQFKEVFDQYSPVTKPEEEDEYENEDLTEADEDIDKKAIDHDYGKLPPPAYPKPLSKDESLKHRNKWDHSEADERLLS